MMNALKKFLFRIGDLVRAPSYTSHAPKKREEKEQMSQPQEEFIDLKSVCSRVVEGKKAAKLR
jgi:hypothetical protein